MQTMNNGRRAFTLVEIMIVVGIIGLLAALAIPNLLRARATSQTKVCIDNLRIIDGAKQQWALEHHAAPTSTPAATDIQPYMGRSTQGLMPTCPADGFQTFATSYNMNNCGMQPTCQIDTNHVLPP